MLEYVSRREMWKISAGGVLVARAAYGQENAAQRESSIDEKATARQFGMKEPGKFATGWPAEIIVSPTLKSLPNVRWDGTMIVMSDSDLQAIEGSKEKTCWDVQPDFAEFQRRVDAVVYRFERLKVSDKAGLAMRVFKNIMTVLSYLGIASVEVMPEITLAMAVVDLGILAYNASIEGVEWMNGIETLKTLQAKMQKYPKGCLVRGLKRTDDGLNDRLGFQDYPGGPSTIVWDADYFG